MFRRDLIKFEIEFFSILRVFIGNLGESFEIQFLAMFYIDILKGI